jgi:hypothetical protein
MFVFLDVDVYAYLCVYVLVFGSHLFNNQLKLQSVYI